MLVIRFFLPLVLAGALAAAEPGPLRVVCMIDQTASTLSTRVPRLQVSDFADLIASLSEVGGELAIGTIRDRSNRPLLRCRLEQRPLSSLHAPPSNINPFLRQKLTRAYLAEKEKQDRADEIWREQCRQRISGFRLQLKQLLEAPLAGRTDIYGAILRADLFLNEPDDGWRRPTRRFAVFHSDGIDNVHAPAIGMASGAAVLLINGSALVGALDVLKPVRLESFSAADRYIRSHSREK